MLKRILFLLGVTATLATSAASLTACNTVQGAGKDMSAAGNKVQEEAREHKNY